MKNFKSWSELQQEANNLHYTKKPARRAQKLAFVAPDMTPDQIIAVNAQRYSYDGMATAFVWENKNKLRYVPQRSKWLYWDGHVWKWDDNGIARELVKAQGRALLTLPTDDKDQKALYVKWHANLTMPRGIDSILNLAASDPMMVVSIDAFDADIYALNTPAGVVDLYTGEVKPATPEALVRRSTTVSPDSACPTPLYDRLLSEAFAGEPELSDYLEQMIGVSLIKAQDDQVFMYLYGAAGSGKGTLMGLASEILGKDENGYVVNVDSSMFVQSKTGAHPTEFMQFLGARMAISSEVSQGQKMDTGKLKKTTGGDPITGRYMNKDFVTFDATHTLWIMANDRLQVPHDDKGVWRRLRVIDFKHPKQGDVITGLQAQILQQEAPGILARWIAKAKQYLNEGYVTPDAVIEAGKSYVAEQDTLQDWLDYRAGTEDPACFTSSEALRNSYVDYCKRERITPLGPVQFGNELEKRGFARDRMRLRTTDKSVTRGHRGIYLAENVTVPF